MRECLCINRAPTTANEWPFVFAWSAMTSYSQLSTSKSTESLRTPGLNKGIAASLASRLVYREGLSWAESLPSEALPTVCLEYLRQEQRIRQLAEDVRTSSLGERDEVSELLIRGGVRAAVESADTRGAAIAA